ncbi:MAG: hypothetical protein KDA52_07850 [Planctomycetaceae bacterium]|nr:hypothetical protein [Planctomycetaceae bacterium]
MRLPLFWGMLVFMRWKAHLVVITPPTQRRQSTIMVVRTTIVVMTTDLRLMMMAQRVRPRNNLHGMLRLIMSTEGTTTKTVSSANGTFRPRFRWRHPFWSSLMLRISIQQQSKRLSNPAEPLTSFALVARLSAGNSLQLVAG